MPWYRVRAMEENELQSLYRSIKSLGDAGEWWLQQPLVQRPSLRRPSSFSNLPSRPQAANGIWIAVWGRSAGRPRNAFLGKPLGKLFIRRFTEVLLALMLGVVRKKRPGLPSVRLYPLD